MPVLTVTLQERGIKFSVAQMYFDYGTLYYSFFQRTSVQRNLGALPDEL